MAHSVLASIWRPANFFWNRTIFHFGPTGQIEESSKSKDFSVYYSLRSAPAGGVGGPSVETEKSLDPRCVTKKPQKTHFLAIKWLRGDFFEIFLVPPKRPLLGGPKIPYGSLCARKRLGVLTKKPQKTHFLAIKWLRGDLEVTFLKFFWYPLRDKLC